MVKQIIGGVAVLVIGGSTFAVSQTDVVDNFSKNSGMSQEQAEDYVNNIPDSEIDSFSTVGQDFINDGNTVQTEIASIDCINYTYEWETPTLSCTDGKNQLQTLGYDEITLGNCYQALDSDLGSNARNKINECIDDIDTVNDDYSFPIVGALLDNSTVSESKNRNIYNKSVLQAALQAK